MLYFIILFFYFVVKKKEDELCIFFLHNPSFLFRYFIYNFRTTNKTKLSLVVGLKSNSLSLSLSYYFSTFKHFLFFLLRFFFFFLLSLYQYLFYFASTFFYFNLSPFWHHFLYLTFIRNLLYIT